MYGTRATLPSLLLLISQERELGRQWQATLLSSFSAGYIWLQIPGGYVSQRMGCRNVLLVAITGSAACLFGVAASGGSDGDSGASSIAFWLALLGVFHAPMTPGRTDLYARWVPPSERAAVLSTEGIAGLVGTLAYGMLAPWLAESVGWRLTFAAQGVSVLLLAVFFWCTVDSSPTAGQGLAAAAAGRRCADNDALPAGAAAGGGGKAAAGATEFPLWLLGRSSVWAIIFAHTAQNYAGEMLKSWAPTILDQSHGLGPAAAAPLLAIPPLFGLAARAALAAAVMPALKARLEPSQLVTRRWATYAYAAGQTAALLLFCHARSAAVATGALCLKAMADAPASLGVGSSYLDVGGRANSGVLTAVGNTVANVGSLLAPTVGAWIFVRFGESWPPVFYSACGLHLSAAAFYGAFISTREEVRLRLGTLEGTPKQKCS
jgi:sugar phosphate permease